VVTPQEYEHGWRAWVDGTLVFVDSSANLEPELATIVAGLQATDWDAIRALYPPHVADKINQG
jgi:hypothetical protein